MLKFLKIYCREWHFELFGHKNLDQCVLLGESKVNWLRSYLWYYVPFILAYHCKSLLLLWYLLTTRIVWLLSKNYLHLCASPHLVFTLGSSREKQWSGFLSGCKIFQFVPKTLMSGIWKLEIWIFRSLCHSMMVSLLNQFLVVTYSLFF